MNYAHLSPCGEASIQAPVTTNLPLEGGSIHREVHTCFLPPFLLTLDFFFFFQW